MHIDRTNTLSKNVLPPVQIINGFLQRDFILPDLLCQTGLFGTDPRQFRIGGIQILLNGFQSPHYGIDDFLRTGLLFLCR